MRVFTFLYIIPRESELSTLTSDVASKLSPFQRPDPTISSLRMRRITLPADLGSAITTHLEVRP